jgi:hypothetical protein
MSAAAASGKRPAAAGAAAGKKPSAKALQEEQRAREEAEAAARDAETRRAAEEAMAAAAAQRELDELRAARGAVARFTSGNVDALLRRIYPELFPDATLTAAAAAPVGAGVASEEVKAAPAEEKEKATEGVASRAGGSAKSEKGKEKTKEKDKGKEKAKGKEKVAEKKGSKDKVEEDAGEGDAGAEKAPPAAADAQSAAASEPVSAFLATLRRKLDVTPEVAQQSQRLRSEQAGAESALLDALRGAVQADHERDAAQMREGLLTHIDVPEETADDESGARAALARSRLLDLSGVLEVEDDRLLRATLPRLKRPPPAVARLQTVRSQEMGQAMRTARERLASEEEVLRRRARRQREHERTLAKTRPSVAVALSPEDELRKTLLFDAMGPSALEANRKVLARMQRSQTFLRNPRFAPAAATGTTTRSFASVLAPQLEPSAAPVRAEPAQVVFSEYERGREYAATLMLRNVSHLSIRMRVLPPTSDKFAVSAPQYPGDSALLAPGMECKLRVFFRPDSLGDFDDELRVCTEAGVLHVPLRGRRPPPELTIASTLACGPCLVGDALTLAFDFVNLGGAGRFWLTAADAPPVNVEAELDRLAAGVAPRSGDLALGEFNVFPTYFESEQHSRGELQVLFRPAAAGARQAAFRLTCDNHSSCDITLAGEGAETRLTLTSMGATALRPEEPRPTLIALPPVAVRAVSSKHLGVFNETPLPVRFRWRIETAVVGGDKSGGGGDELSVTPAVGEFEAHGARDFEFAAQLAAPHNARWTATLLVEQPAPLPTLEAMSFEVQATGLPCVAESRPSMLLLPQVARGVETRVAFRLANLSASASEFALAGVEDESGAPFRQSDAWEVAVTPAKGMLDAPLGEAAVEVVLRARKLAPLRCCLRFSLALGSDVVVPLRVEAVEGPRVLLSPGDLDFGVLDVGLPNVAETRKLTLRNTSSSSCRFALSSDAAALLSFSPASDGELAAGEVREVAVTFAPRACMSLRASIDCRVDGGPREFISVRGEAQAPRVTIEPVRIQLGACFVNVARTIEFTVVNHTHLPGDVRLDDADDAELGFRARFFPNALHLDGLEEADVTLEFAAWKPGPLTALLLCDVQGMARPLPVEITTTVETLRVSLHEAAADAAMRGAVAEARERLGEYAAAQQQMLAQPPQLTKRSSVGIDEDGHSQARSVMSRRERENKLQTELQLKLDGVRAAFDRAGYVWGAAPCSVDFGAACPVFQPQRRRVIIRNHSAIATSYAVHVERFAPPTHAADAFAATASCAAPHSRSVPPLLAASAGITGRLPLDASARHSPLLLTAAKEATEYFRSSPGKSFVAERSRRAAQDAALERGQGVCFFVAPARGVLAAWDAVEVEIECLTDKCGDFTDALVVQVQGLPPARVPLHICVTGTPLSVPPSVPGMRRVPASAAAQDLCATPGAALLAAERVAIGWSPLASRAAAVSKRVRIVNGGPEDVLIRWRIIDRAAVDGEALVETEIAPDAASGQVRVALRPYEVRESRTPLPFSVAPVELRVPRRGSAWATVTFDASSIVEGEFGAFLDGVLWLPGDEATARAPQPLGGCRRYPCLLELEALVVRAHLDVDKKTRPDGEQALRFRVAAPQGDAAPAQIRSIPLLNDTLASLAFTVRCEPSERFAVAEVESGDLTASVLHPLASSPLPRGGVSPALQLAPRASALVAVRFTPPSPGATAQWPLAATHTVRGNAVVEFSNGDRQMVALEATLLRPCLSLSDAALRFAPTHVCASRDLAFVLSNPSRVAARWQLVHVPSAAKRSLLDTRASDAAVLRSLDNPEFDAFRECADDPSVFSFSATSGTVGAQSLAVTSGMNPLPVLYDKKGREAVTVRVIFRPKTRGRYRSRFVVRVEHAVVPELLLLVEGEGSLDEALLPKE